MRDRVLVWDVPGAVDPEAAFAALFEGAEHAFWLDTGGAVAGPGAAGAATGGTSYLGAAAWAIDSEEIRARGGSVFGWLRAERARWDVDASAAAGGFALGLVGWFGYELFAETLGLGASAPRRYPDAAFLMVDRCLAVSQADGSARLLAVGRSWDDPGLVAWRDGVLAALSSLSTLPAPALHSADRHDVPIPARSDRAETGTSYRNAGEPGGREVRWAYDDAAYLEMIRACKHAIADGDAYVLCLTTEASVAGAFDPWEAYRRVRRTSPSHHGAYLRSGTVALLSATPEQFLTVRDGWVETKPIKGTRPRGATQDEDAALAVELRDSPKERAENVMIVDLMRNDLSRVCLPGTVEVVKLLDVETYPHVHQLVSTVGGRLAPGRDAVSAIESCFPAGSMTGAPKHSAVSILSRLEGRSRGVYAGAFGYLGFDGGVDLAMTIRSIVIDPDGATIGTGGGITALSDPEEELAETRLKAAALLGALGAA